MVGPSHQKGHLLLDYSKPQMALTQEPTKKQTFEYKKTHE